MNLGLLNIGSTAHIVDSRLRVELEDIYFHPHTVDHAVNMSTGAAMYTKYVTNDFDNYGLDADKKDNVQHVFLTGDLNSSGGHASGIGVQGYIVLAAWYNHYLEFGATGFSWKLPPHFIHELAHSCGLFHNFHGGPNGNQCDDCSDNDPVALPCPIQATSNNYMDYFPLGYASLNPNPGFSECQLSKMHWRLSGYGSISKTVKKDYCDVNPLETITINNSSIWKSHKRLTGDLIIEDGGQLVVTCVVHMPKNGKVVIKPGGKLIIDQGEFTNECGDYWKGIEVWGDNTLPQTPQNQGHLITQNGAKIEFAREAISTWSVGDYSTTGGIVHCTNTEFKNNRTSAYFYPYQYVNAGIETLNSGFFTNCEFLWDDNYIDQSPEAGVIMYNVNGVTIKGSDFIDSRTNLTGGDSRPKGIFSLDAGYKVIARNTTLGTLPVHEVFDPTGGYDVNNFVNLDYGIYSLGANSARTITADHCKFENVMHGINLSAVDNAFLTRNLVEYNSSHPTDIGVSLGIEISESTGYTIQGNTFNNYDAEAFTGGVLAWDTGSDENEIRKNYYNDQNLANYGYGINSNTTDILVQQFPEELSGLTWLCNEGVNNRLDLANYAQVGIDGEGVKLWQGNIGESVGNKFTDVSYSGLSAHVLHTGDDQMQYFVFDADPQQIPTILDGDVFLILQGDERVCNSIFQDEIIVEESRMMSSSSESQLSAEIIQLDQDIQTKQIQLETDLSDGDDSQLHQMVATITPINKHIVRDSLYAASPYLSRQLLEELGEKPLDCFSHVWYVALIQANIEVTRSDAFMTYLENKTNPIPSGLYDQIDSMRFVHFTERGEREMEINRLSTLRHNKANLLVVNELSDSSEINWNHVQQKMIQRKNKVCRAEVSDQFLGRGNSAECLALLDSIDQNLSDYTLDHEHQEMQDFSTFKRYVLNITNNTGVVEELDVAQIQELSTMADQFTGRAAIQARNLLCFHAGLCENREVILPPNSMQIVTSENLTTEPSGLSGVEAQLRVIPNPNKGEFVLEVPKECSITQLNIVDIQGKEVPFEILEQIENTNRILILNKETGILFLKAQCDDGSVYSTRIVVNN